VFRAFERFNQFQVRRFTGLGDGCLAGKSGVCQPFLFQALPDVAACPSGSFDKEPAGSYH
jgi:hypothetical protein